MSLDIVSLKLALRIDGDDQDDNLERLLNSATQEALRFMGRMEVPTFSTDGFGDSSSSSSSSSEDNEPMPDVVNAIFLLVQGDLDGDPQKRQDYVDGAFNLMRPYRVSLGMA